MRLDGAKLTVTNRRRLREKLERLGEIRANHPDAKVREGLRDIIDQIHARHVRQ